MDVFWSFSGRSKASFLQACVQDETHDTFWIDLAFVLGRFWEGCGKVCGRHLGGLKSKTGGGQCLREAVSIKLTRFSVMAAHGFSFTEFQIWILTG